MCGRHTRHGAILNLLFKTKPKNLNDRRYKKTLFSDIKREIRCIVHLLLDSTDNSNISTGANLEETIRNDRKRDSRAARFYRDISLTHARGQNVFVGSDRGVDFTPRHAHARTRLISRFFRFKNETRQSYDNSTRVCSTSRFRSRFREKGKLFQNKESKLEKVIERE